MDNITRLITNEVCFHASFGDKCYEEYMETLIAIDLAKQVAPLVAKACEHCIHDDIFEVVDAIVASTWAYLRQVPPRNDVFYEKLAYVYLENAETTDKCYFTQLAVQELLEKRQYNDAITQMTLFRFSQLS